VTTRQLNAVLKTAGVHSVAEACGAGRQRKTREKFRKVLVTIHGEDRLQPYTENISLLSAKTQSQCLKRRR
jgi:hypothetical protein